MRIYALIAAFTLVSVAAHAQGRSLSLNGVDQKLPGSLGRAAETPRIVEAPLPLDPPRPPAPPPAVAVPAPAVAAPAPPPPVAAPTPAVAAPAPAVAAPAIAAPAPAVEAPKAETPAYVPRPSVAGTKPADSKEGQVTFDESKPAPAVPATTAAPEKSKQAKADKPRRKRHWDEARIMREISRYSGYAGMIGGW